MLSTELGSEDTEVNRTDEIFPLLEFYSSGRLEEAEKYKANTLLTKKSTDCEE